MNKPLTWQKAKRLCRLSAEEVEMAKVLGLKPEALIHNIPARSGKKEPWKDMPGERVRKLYAKTFPEKNPPVRAKKE